MAAEQGKDPERANEPLSDCDAGCLANAEYVWLTQNGELRLCRWHSLAPPAIRLGRIGR